MVFTLAFSETLAVLMEGLAGFFYNFLPGFFVLLFLILPIIIFYKIIVRGSDMFA